MKATLLAILAVGCTREPAKPAITVAQVDVSNLHCRSDCPSQLGLYHVCSGNFAYVEPETDRLDVETVVDAADIVHLVQLQYRGAVTYGDRPHLDYVLERNGAVEVRAAFDTDAILYRIDERGDVVDIDRERLAAATDRTLRFAYPPGAATVVEKHVIEKPRVISINAGETFPFCCSTGQPTGVGFVLIALFVARRRRCRIVA